MFFIVLVAVQMGCGLKPSAHRDVPATMGMLLTGGLIGGISALFGIGGGSLMVPFLSYCHVRMQYAVATAAAVGFPLALAGVLGSIFAGFANPLLPQNSIGYVYWPAFLSIVAGSVLSAPVGAKLAHRLPADKLKKLFAVLLMIIGVEFVSHSWGLL